MIFKPEMVELILSGRKTVTRRPVKTTVVGGIAGNVTNATPLNLLAACRYEVGKDYAIQPGRGKKAVGRLRVIGVEMRTLGGGLDWPLPEAGREGFDNWSGFRDYWYKLYGTYDPTQLVHRIEFELLPDPPPTTSHEGEES